MSERISLKRGESVELELHPVRQSGVEGTIWPYGTRITWTTDNDAAIGIEPSEPQVTDPGNKHGGITLTAVSIGNAIVTARAEVEGNTYEDAFEIEVLPADSEIPADEIGLFHVTRPDPHAPPVLIPLTNYTLPRTVDDDMTIRALPLKGGVPQSAWPDGTRILWTGTPGGQDALWFNPNNRQLTTFEGFFVDLASRGQAVGVMILRCRVLAPEGADPNWGFTIERRVEVSASENPEQIIGAKIVLKPGSKKSGA